MPRVNAVATDLHHAMPPMKSLLLQLIGALQMLLGVLYLVAPHWLLQRMGHQPIPADLAYPLAMLAARFLAYGLGLWWAARDPMRHAGWIRLMTLIQLIDLGAGVFYTATGVVSPALSALPMFNAVWIAVVCWRLGTPRTPTTPLPA